MSSTIVAASAYLPAPLHAAPEIPDYPQFRSVAVPPGCNAVRAWEGIVQPFLDSATARRFLHCVEAGKHFDIADGTIDAEAPANARHWADAWLVKMELRFRLLVLEFDGAEHPRAYALQPEISRQMHPLHPHLRTDRQIIVSQRSIPALCIYSGAEFHYSQRWPRLVQFLDQVSAYIGRHIIWLKTRIELPHRFGSVFRIPHPGEPIFDHIPLIKTDPNLSAAKRHVSLFSGYWPGSTAPSGAVNHLRSISRSQECWCCSGKKYGECHRPIEMECLRLQSSQ
jgi:SEC-C motif